MAGVTFDNFEAMVNNPPLLEFLEAMVRKAKDAQKTKQDNQSCASVIVSPLEIHALNEDQDGIPSSSDAPNLKAPAYDEIFCPPKGKDRDPTKLYGKELLEKKFPPEYHVTMLDNYRTVRRWFHDVSLPTDLRHNQKDKDDIMRIIHKKYNEIKPLAWRPGAVYKWKVEDIYKWVVAAKQSKQKYKKTKNVLVKGENNTHFKKEENDAMNQSEFAHVSTSEDIEEMQKNDIIIEHDHLEKEDFFQFDGMTETDKFLMQMKSFDGLQSYQEEEVDTLQSDLPLSYTELLHTGHSKRVQASKDLPVALEVPESDEMIEKMKSLCELDYARKKEASSDKKIASRHANNAKDGNCFQKRLDVDLYTLEDMETILMVYTRQKIVHDMYFCLRKTYVSLKKEDTSFRSYCKDFKNPESHLMVKLISTWLIEMNKVVVNGCTPLSAKDIQLFS